MSNAMTMTPELKEYLKSMDTLDDAISRAITAKAALHPKERVFTTELVSDLEKLFLALGMEPDAMDVMQVIYDVKHKLKRVKPDE